ncbi:colicin immunity domain-containing protein [Actinomycetes bacterium M1A6_2h]
MEHHGTRRFQSCVHAWWGNGDVVATVTENHAEVISAFIAGSISASEFEADYIRVFTTDKSHSSAREFTLIENLFFAVDDYVEDPVLREAVSGIGPNELRRRAQETFDALCNGTK